MNERIKELRVTASEWMSAQGRPLEYRSDWEKQCDEKFAELIVNECIEQVEQAKNSPFVNLTDANRMKHFVDVTTKKIQKHFQD
jgi:hypothetical protein